MKVSVEGQALAEMAGLVRHAIARKPSLPVLGAVLLEAGAEGWLRCVATDLERRIEAEVPAAVEAAGRAAPEGMRFVAVARELGAAGPVELGARGARLELRGGGGRFLLPALPTEELPGPPALETVAHARLSAEALVLALRRAAPAMARDGARPALCAASISASVGGRELVVEATDGHRLVVAPVPVEELRGRWPERALVPGDAVAALTGLRWRARPVELAVGGGWLEARQEGLRVAVRLVEGGYPQTAALLAMTRQYAATTTLETEPLRTALRRVALVAEERVVAVEVRLGDGRAQLRVAGERGGEAEAELPCAWAEAPVRVGVNARYLLDFLGQVRTPTVRLGLRGALDPLRWLAAEDGEPVVEYLVMPMRL